MPGFLGAAVCCGALVFGAAAGAAAAEAAETPIPESEASARQNHLAYDEKANTLSAWVNGAPFSWVMSELEDSLGLDVVVYEDEYGVIFANFEALPLEDGLKRLLAATNHMILKREHSTKVLVLSWVGGPPVDMSTDTHAAAATETVSPDTQLVTPATDAASEASDDLQGNRADAETAESPAVADAGSDPEDTSSPAKKPEMTEAELAELRHELISNEIEFALDERTRRIFEVLENLPEGADFTEALENAGRGPETYDLPDDWQPQFSDPSPAPDANGVSPATPEAAPQDSDKSPAPDGG